MWHEARKHEKKIRGMMVDYKRRAERRREFYEKIRRDPAQFLQIHGQKAKIHLDANISQAAEMSLMAWRGDQSNMIDRFDVRAHLDFIDTNTTQSECDNDFDSTNDNENERRINYERWRNLVQNEYLNISESKTLHQIWLEERFGMNQASTHDSQHISKKKLAEKKAAIAYNYEKEDESSLTVGTKKQTESESSSEESDSDDDYDTSVNIDTLTLDQGIRLNSLGQKFGLKGNDFLRFLEEDKAEAERIRLAKEIENEKSMFSGRKSRRERRALKERRMLILRANNTEDNSKSNETKKSESSSSESDISEPDVDEAKIEFITSFGGSSDEEKESKSIKSVKDVKNVSKKKKSDVKASKLLNKGNSPVVFGPSLPPDSHEIVEKTNFNATSSKSRSYSSKRPETASAEMFKSDTIKEKFTSAKTDAIPNQTISPAEKQLKETVESNSITISTPQAIKLPSPPVKRYYRHDLAKESSESESDESVGNDEIDIKASKSVISVSTLSTKASGAHGLLKPQERLKKKTQALIEKQFKLDKKAEKEKREKLEQERVDRDEELKELATKMRYRLVLTLKAFSRYCSL
ncbi:hypothetical protein B4U79_09452 [Dinothrombium tinctorium]|uniref:Suppressor of white apricot N-terminal domain-containing protein n=1 Tax=Dinothrombium tinctorium TaxID=1965070 RepID=A0A3S3QI79_9ACAR|nr:hypothetical protein B4U79_06260 [Dinothrombium tinctorium]RWS09147.1 hypothetical protein B4U79_09452 [Dinothrombium tinctorium]